MSITGQHLIAGPWQRTGEPTFTSQNPRTRTNLEWLFANVYQVLNVDLNPPSDWKSHFRRRNLTDYGQVVAALHGFEAVIQLASDSRPDRDLFTGAQRFHNNTLCTYNVFNAACALGVKRVVWASSETIHGYPFENSAPDHVPVDEAHRPLLQNSYAISKLISEEIARQFNHQYGVTIIGLRFSNILYPLDYERCPQFWADPKERIFNLWSYVDYRDAADSVRLCLESDIGGADVFIIAATDTIMNTPSAALMKSFFPGTVIHDNLGEFASLNRTDKATKFLGYQPKHSWRDYHPAGGA